MTKEELKEKEKVFRRSFKDANSILKRGNILMLAIGLLLGASLGAVISSLANDVIMASISSLFNVKSVEELKVGNILIGKFLAALIQFLIVSFFIFIASFIIFLIKNIIDYHKAKKLPITDPVVEVPKPTTEELILKELKELNKKLDSLSVKKDE